MTEYREILRLHSLGHSIRGIAMSVPCARNTAARTVKLAKEAKLEWQQARDMTDGEIEKMLFARQDEPQDDERAIFIVCVITSLFGVIKMTTRW